MAVARQTQDERFAGDDDDGGDSGVKQSEDIAVTAPFQYVGDATPLVAAPLSLWWPQDGGTVERRGMQPWGTVRSARPVARRDTRFPTSSLARASSPVQAGGSGCTGRSLTPCDEAGSNRSGFAERGVPTRREDSDCADARKRRRIGPTDIACLIAACSDCALVDAVCDEPVDLGAYPSLASGDLRFQYKAPVVPVAIEGDCHTCGTKRRRGSSQELEGPAGGRRAIKATTLLLGRERS